MNYDIMKRLMKEQKITQRELAERLGKHPRSVESWIYDKQDIDVYTAYMIALILNTSVEYLVTGHEPAAGIPKDLQQVIDKYASHTETQDVPDYTILCADNPPDMK